MFELLLLRKKKSTQSSGPYTLIGGLNFADVNESKKTYKYFYVDDVFSTGTSLKTKRWVCMATGNLSVGIFAGGYGTNSKEYLSSTEKYQYDNNTTIASFNLSTGRSYGAGISDNLNAVFFKGEEYDGVNGWPRGTVERYTYSTNSKITNSYITHRAQHCSANNDTLGINAGGTYGTGQYPSSTTTELYRFSNNVLSMGANLLAKRDIGAAVGNIAFCIIAGGSTYNSASAEKYTFSNNAIASTTSLTKKRAGCSGSGNSEFGLFVGGGGQTGSSNSIDRYTYATDTCLSTSTLMTVALAWQSATSSSPGWAA
ncbi:MAG: hypothetical protein PHQ58_04385 [Rhodoferax sp.]|uniref:hypothetical protein n=1 Tax=Rhodoferax sp. TaxID=50421 RepID=UPI00261C3585|nr:hypothetical protein [Rhodoferax sp.]MDD2879653.1 hypothetical protein [Rhodoferax sp.]